MLEEPCNVRPWVKQEARQQAIVSSSGWQGSRQESRTNGYAIHKSLQRSELQYSLCWNRIGEPTSLTEESSH
jgi:hypothetical protein